MSSAYDRLVDAVTELGGNDGYASATVERLLQVAGVSRATFYQYFTNVDDCFWSAYRQHADHLVYSAAVAATGSREREIAVLDALVVTAVARPAVARLLMREGLAAGPIGAYERDALIARIEQAVRGSPTLPSTIDLPTTILIGGTFGYLSMRISDGSPVEGLGEEVREWARSFARRPSDGSWSTRLAPALPHPVPQRLTPSSPTKPSGTPRERIRNAVATTIQARGYHQTTVADIVAAAGISRRAFYNEFPGKVDAFIAACEHGFQQTIAACAPGFLSTAAWPERVWHGAQAFAGFMAREPQIAHLSFVECYAIGPQFALRVHAAQRAFTLFLEEGYRQGPTADSLSRSCSVLTATAIFELAFQGTRRDPSLYMRSLQPLAVYIALAPFIGLEDAGQFVIGKLSAYSRAPAAA
jgi:AcrR family transcriptional regulator